MMMPSWTASTTTTTSTNNRTTQSILAIGTLIVVASICIINTHLSSTARPATEEDDGHKPNATQNNAGTSTSFLPSHVQREIYKLRQRKSKIPLISMKKPMYDNVYMLDQDHELLCTISMKKANWYIKKGIAEWSSFRNDKKGTAKKDPYYGKDAKCIRLLFDHSGSSRRRKSDTDTSKSTPPTSSSETLYLCSTKHNICVACGKSGYHIRHYIVPFVYRTLLPDKYKSHMSHDIVILCPNCHLDCERLTKRRMTDMENKLRMKVTSIKCEDNHGDGCVAAPNKNTNHPVIDDPKLGQVRSCALALMKWRSTMPEEQVERYERVVRTYLATISSGCTIMEDEEKLTTLTLKEHVKLTEAQLQKAITVKYRTKNPNYIPGAEIVIRSLNGEEKNIEFFIRGWRHFFIDTVHPQHMPMGWDIDNPVVCGSREKLEDDD